MPAAGWSRGESERRQLRPRCHAYDSEFSRCLMLPFTFSQHTHTHAYRHAYRRTHTRTPRTHTHTHTHTYTHRHSSVVVSIPGANFTFFDGRASRCLQAGGRLPGCASHGTVQQCAMGSCLRAPGVVFSGIAIPLQQRRGGPG